MLDMGFLPDVRRVIKHLPEKRQTLFFSATMPAEIMGLTDQLLVNPAVVNVDPVSSTAEAVEQHLYFVDKSDKARLLVDLLRDEAKSRALVFTRTKHGANKLTKQLLKANVVAAAIHGNKSQGARVRALEGFREGKIRVLVATDVAARGIDVDGVSHVFNYDLPNVPETYVHRIGRTGRAGRSGIALSFCDVEERPYLVDIERLIGTHVPRIVDHACPPTQPLPPETDLNARSRGGKSGAGRGSGKSQSQSRGRGSRGRGGRRGSSGGRRSAAGSGRRSS